MIDGRAGLKPIRPIAPNWTPRWNYLISAVQVNTTTHYRSYIKQLVPAHPEVGTD